MSTTGDQTPSATSDVMVVRYDYPPAVHEEWAVFWEVGERAEFEEAVQQSDLSDYQTAWIAISPSAVVDLGAHR